jgi:4'-phosphopantetheinyl transferase
MTPPDNTRRIDVRLWTIHLPLELDAAETARWSASLSDDEIARFDAFQSKAAGVRFLVCRNALRTVLGGEIGCDPASIAFTYSDSGKPEISPDRNAPRICFNLSHADGVAFIATTRGVDVGVDVERVDRERDVHRIARRFFTVNEREELARCGSDERVRRFYLMWTVKEAWLKSRGEGVPSGLDRIEVAVAADGRVSLSDSGSSVTAVDAGVECAAAIVVRKAGEIAIDVRRFDC